VDGTPSRWGPRVVLAQLIQAGLLQPGEQLYWPRANKGQIHTATLTADGTLQLADGTHHANPSAAITALGLPNNNGWKLWRRTRDNHTLDTTRQHYLNTTPGPATTTAPEPTTP
jgi:hypothetical protein